MLRNFDTEAELIKLSFENMLVRWGSNTPVRTGLHASSVLVPEQEWCVRRHVLAELFPDEAVAPELQSWDWRMQAIFENGWDLHKRWQKIFRFKGRVVSEMVMDAQNRPIREYELDRTHYDETRNIYFSPDAIIDFAGQRYVVEIKGINHDEYTGHEEMYKRTFAKPGSAWTFNYDKVQETRKGVKDCDTIEEAMEVSQTVNKAVYQANLYMHLLELKKAIILVENKNNQDFKLWVIEYSKDTVNPLLERIYETKKEVRLTRFKVSNMPVRICASRGDALARKCPMKDCCFSEKMEE